MDDVYARIICLLVAVSTVSGSYTISVRLSSKDVKLSGSATFYCDVSGTPKPVVSHWTIGPASPIPSGFRYVYNTAKTRFNVLSVTMQDQGDYYCHATAADGTKISAHAYLPVIDRFTISPQSDTVREGKDAILRCPVNKPAGVKVYWYFNSLSISSMNSNYSIGGTYQEELRVLKASRVRNGTYTCYAQNSQWSFKAFPNLIVEYPPSVVSDVSASTVIVGVSVTMSCTFSAQPLPSISFRRGSLSIDTGDVDYEISQVDVRSGVRKSTLTIKYVELHDEGIYTCLANNQHGLITSGGAKLTVRPHFVFPVYYDKKAIKRGANETISCVSNMTRVDEWKFNGTVIDFSSNPKQRRLLPDGSLKILNVQPSDRGTYECIGIIRQNNLYGEGKKVTTVTVLQKPSAPLLKTPAFSIEGFSVQIKLDWVAPRSNGGSNIIDYLIKWQVVSGEEKSLEWEEKKTGASSTSLDISVTVSPNARSIQFKIEAVNNVGLTESNVQALPLDFSIPTTASPLTTGDTIDDGGQESIVRDPSVTKTNTIGIIAGSVVGLALLCAIIIAILVVRKRKKSKSASDKEIKDFSSAEGRDSVTRSSQSSTNSTLPLVPSSAGKPMYMNGSGDPADIDSASVFTSSSSSDSSTFPKDRSSIPERKKNLSECSSESIV